MREFLIKRVNFAKSLYKDSEIATYHDIALILTSVLSACASRTWVGDRIDRVRFIELLINHSKEKQRTSNISIPYLINDNHINDTHTEWARPGYSTRILTDTEVDIPLNQAVIKYPNLAVSTLKSYSYAHFIYKLLRCGYAHTYYLDSSLSYVAPSNHYSDTRISYISELNYPNEAIRRIGCFHIEYLIDLAEHHAHTLKCEPLPHPNEWWANMN